MNTANIIFWGVLTFSILIVLHEGGHFFAARMFGVKVHEFMLGLPGPAVRFTTKSTTYGITMIPLGGYVRIAGMEPGPEDELLGEALKAISLEGRFDARGLADKLGIDRDRAAAMLAMLADWGAIEPAADDDISYVGPLWATVDTDADEMLALARKQTYRGLSTGKRVAVLAAGVLVNLLTAIVIFTVVLSIWGYDVPSMTISKIGAGTPAAEAGLQEGDTILSINEREFSDWFELVNYLAITPPDTTATLVYERDGVADSVTLTFAKNPDTGAALLGISSGEIKHISPSVLEALGQSLQWTRDSFFMIMAFFNPETFQIVAQNARSVVGVSVEAANVVKYGKALGYAQFIALLSLSLGIMNILPIPPLDGGKVVVEIVERVGGRPLGRKLQIGLSLTGALLLFSLIGYLMYADVLRYFVNA